MSVVKPSNLSIKTIKPQKIKWYKLQNDSFDARLDNPLDCPKRKKNPIGGIWPFRFLN